MKTINGDSQYRRFEPESDVKAFIYQQVQDLEPFTKDLGSLAVVVEKEEIVGVSRQERFAVTILVAPESFNLKVRYESNDIFEACRLAKEAARRKLNSVLNALSGDSGVGSGKGAEMSPPNKNQLH